MDKTRYGAIEKGSRNERRLNDRLDVLLRSNEMSENMEEVVARDGERVAELTVVSQFERSYTVQLRRWMS